MKHRRRAMKALLATPLAFLGVAQAGFPRPAIAKGVQHWKMVMTWQKALPGLGTGAVRLAKRIAALSEGKLEVKIYGGGEMVPPLGVFDAVAQGTVEMGHTASYYWLNKHKASAFFTAVPGGMTAQEHAAWLYFGGGQQLWDELYKPFGVRAFAAGNTGTQMGGWFTREINTPEDLKGLKMRMPGLAGEVLSRLGGSAQTIPPQELFTALQSGVIDALEWVGPWNDMALGFHQIAPYYYGPGFHEGGATLELLVNKEAFASLSKEMQRVVKTACATENALMLAEYYANNIRAFAALKSLANVEVRVYPDAIQQLFYQHARDVVAEVGEKDDISRKIYESYQHFQQQSMAMEPVSEYGFMQGRRLVTEH